MSFPGILAARLSGREAASDEALERALGRHWARCLDAWPELEPHAEPFAEHVGERLHGSGVAPDALDGVAFADLGLAFLALSGEPRALRELSHRALRIATKVVARGAGPDLDELMFSLEGKLFDPVGSKLVGYSGTGGLDGWLSVLTTRTWLNLKRDRREVPQDILAERTEPSEASLLGQEGARLHAQDPELAYLKELYTDQFRSAFSRAAQSLDPEQRNVLRAYYGGGASIDVIAAGRGVHRATAARRVGKAREQLLSETRRLLIAELDLSRSDLESVMRLIQSQLHLTLSRVFADP
ncbi:MAG: hypothetical protein KC731_29930 [Myxococcales bacterium]|nr:hypothetical protein [Myxococcales bacterium]